MAQLLSKSWVANVYSPAADSGVDIIVLTRTGKMRKVQVKTSRIYPSGGTWFQNISRMHLEEDSTAEGMFYVLAEGHPPISYLVFPANELLNLFQNRFEGTCQGRLVRFEGASPAGTKFKFSRFGPEQRRKATLDARISSKSIDKYWNNWDLLK